MGMIGVGVDLELAELLHAQLGAWQHALDRAPYDFLRSAFEQMPQGFLAIALRIAAVADVELAVELVARDGDAARIEDDHEVAGVEVGGIAGLVLALEDVGD